MCHTSEKSAVRKALRVYLITDGAPLQNMFARHFLLQMIPLPSDKSDAPERNVNVLFPLQHMFCVTISIFGNIVHMEEIANSNTLLINTTCQTQL